jgi:hypothetical protein
MKETSSSITGTPECSGFSQQRRNPVEQAFGAFENLEIKTFCIDFQQCSFGNDVGRLYRIESTNCDGSRVEFAQSRAVHRSLIAQRK